MHVHPLITDSATLANLCARLSDAPFVTVDTEFMRESTYYPELCLIQIADVNEAAAIDPMAPIEGTMFDTYRYKLKMTGANATNYTAQIEYEVQKH